MHTSELFYEGDLRTIATHVYSGEKIFTDAPLDNQGKAQSFSPTDLLATSLAACMITIMGIAARTHQYEIEGCRMYVTKIMAANPRRVSEIQIRFELPASLDEKARAVLEHAARHCPVAKSLHPEINQAVTFEYSLTK